MDDNLTALTAFRQALLDLDSAGARRILLDAPGAIPAARRVEQIVVPVLEQLGRDWEQGRLALSQIYMAGRICEELVDLALPAASPERHRHPPVAVATLEDYHLLGKRMVLATLRAGGYDALDYGRMEVSELAARCLKDQVAILLVSTLMLPSALRVKALTDTLRASGAAVKTIVGGAPFRYDPELWRVVGADGAGMSAGEAIPLVQRFSGGVL